METKETTGKSPKALYWFGGIFLFLAVAYAIYKYTSFPALIMNKLNPKYNNGGDLIVDYGDEINTDKIMRLGDQGNNVTRLQTEVNKFITEKGLSTIKLSVDGAYGNKTETAIKEISNNILHSGNVTVNKVANLQSIGSLNPAPTSTEQPTTTTTYTGGRFSKYSN